MQMEYLTSTWQVLPRFHHGNTAVYSTTEIGFMCSPSGQFVMHLQSKDRSINLHTSKFNFRAMFSFCVVSGPEVDAQVGVRHGGIPFPFPVATPSVRYACGD